MCHRTPATIHLAPRMVHHLPEGVMTMDRTEQLEHTCEKAYCAIDGIMAVLSDVEQACDDDRIAACIAALAWCSRELEEACEGD